MIAGDVNAAMTLFHSMETHNSTFLICCQEQESHSSLAVLNQETANMTERWLLHALAILTSSLSSVSEC